MLKEKREKMQAELIEEMKKWCDENAPRIVEYSLSGNISNWSGILTWHFLEKYNESNLINNFSKMKEVYFYMWNKLNEISKLKNGYGVSLMPVHFYRHQKISDNITNKKNIIKIRKFIEQTENINDIIIKYAYNPEIKGVSFSISYGYIYITDINKLEEELEKHANKGYLDFYIIDKSRIH